MVSERSQSEDRIRRAFALAVDEKPAYADLYPWLECLFLILDEVKQGLALDPPPFTAELVELRWENGFPLLRRSELPLDAGAAEDALRRITTCFPKENKPLSEAGEALTESLTQHAGYESDFWNSFLQEDLGAWEEWVAAEGLDFASVVFLARSCLRPSFEWIAESLAKRFPVPDTWLKGYCPVCGSLPALLLLQGEGERRGYCSWCGTLWALHRLQCPYCDNRDHETLGYLYIEAEPHHRVQYCEKCRHYYKQIDLRERLYPAFLPLEEWTTLHLDLLAQRAGWSQSPSAAPGI